MNSRTRGHERNGNKNTNAGRE